MFELRILSGMHRGATLPLDQRALNIGADDDADVVLVDPGIAADHATLTPGAQGWTLEARDGELRGSEDNRLRERLELAAGQFARLGHVWLCVAGADAPWQSPPPEPAPSAADEPLDDVRTLRPPRNSGARSLFVTSHVTGTCPQEPISYRLKQVP